MKKQTIKIYFLFITTLFLSCSENDNLVTTITEDVLPPITQTGANTFGCVINGAVFIPKDKTGYTPPGGGTPRGIEVLGNNSVFVIQARNYINTAIYIYIPEDIPKQTTYIFGESPGVSYGLNSPDYAHIFCIINNKKYLSFEDSGSILFSKVNQTSGLYAGVFTVKLKNKDDENDILEISEGRFDINIATLNN
ncbi:MAG: hypothetical protein GW772_01905 [Flavobacteriia bacterium]|nr:hypothetical protein [Flavobacteriia bacterium]PIV96186.1 MAG: hypothetical protein COW43_09990 [Flavobacteriaceae bacterium CG17_big_fil_post_rev_8_21_14_2_50_31_13]PIX13908.1 MAG: hypothetical protein COZ74_04350 [Flavobacteriaceae bacterium CG_4_8_14_3_um_filter_31_8]PIY14402.1 MAG: hypothetical protein COZ16_09720 [Flavobacteriaceae bacterium CG_4_10_14_3_um_filter_31_253]PIZ10490.1 MAG: hypothetical protein COY55_08760 [Flavobacteriaceae bacterium CG_4_10_14_0_8_um_filter_31_99]PJC1109